VQDAGGYINAYTSFDRTVYWIDIPSKGVSTALELLADAVMNSTLPPEEYVKEQEVIRREFAMGNDDPDRWRVMRSSIRRIGQHPYRHPVIGHFDVFNGLTRDDVMAYYKARYVPNNIFFVVTGDVDPEKVRAQLAEAFRYHPRKSLVPVYIPAEPPQMVAAKRTMNSRPNSPGCTSPGMCRHLPIPIFPRSICSGRSSAADAVRAFICGSVKS
jgi:zinc protease